MISDEYATLCHPVAAATAIPWNIAIPLGVTGVALSLLCWAVFFQGIVRLIRMFTLAQPDHTRTNHPFRRLGHMFTEFLAHTRVLKRRTVGILHWLVMMGFLFGTIVWFEAYIQVFDPAGGWPWLHYQTWYHGLDEFLGLATVAAGIGLILIRQIHNPAFRRRPESKKRARFYRSNMGAAYFVEAVVIIEGLGMLLVKAGQIATFPSTAHPSPYVDWVTYWLAQVLPANAIMVSLFALLKLLTGMLWLYVVGRNLSWGVAWHRLAAFFNIYFKREADGRNALRTVTPLTSTEIPTTDSGRRAKKQVKVLTADNLDAENDQLGIGQISDFTWKDWLDFSVCTECGRCQDLCPAWATDKPLNPKFLITELRDIAQGSAPYIRQAQHIGFTNPHTGRLTPDALPRLVELLPDSSQQSRRRQRKTEQTRLELLHFSQPLVGPSAEAAADAGTPELAGLLNEEVIWACTTCGACVEVCPLDIEHVDHLVGLRRHQVLEKAEFPPELVTMFNHLETKGNPWGQPADQREDWVRELAEETGFQVPVWGKDVTDFAGSGMEYLFWVGCAGAYDNHAREATKATALLLHLAGVKFCILGNQETCTGDSARRAGNEFLFQEMAARNNALLSEVFGSSPAKIIATCAHCFNTLGNEYEGDYTVVHHSELLNQLVNRRRLVPTTPVVGLTTFHDPCYLGRHNGTYEEPREVVDAAGTSQVEMRRIKQESFCCGAGGANFWHEEKGPTRINLTRVDEAIATGADTIATACPFCTIMLSDGVSQRASESNGVNQGAAESDAEQASSLQVKDISVLLLESVKRNGALPQPLVGMPVGEITDSTEGAEAEASDANSEDASTVEHTASEGTAEELETDTSEAEEVGAAEPAEDATDAESDQESADDESAVGAPAVGVPSLGAPSLGAPSLGTPSLGTPSLGAPTIGASAAAAGAAAAVGAPVPGGLTLGGPRPISTPADDAASATADHDDAVAADTELDQARSDDAGFDDAVLDDSVLDDADADDDDIAITSIEDVRHVCRLDEEGETADAPCMRSPDITLVDLDVPGLPLIGLTVRHDCVPVAKNPGPSRLLVDPALTASYLINKRKNTVIATRLPLDSGSSPSVEIGTVTTPSGGTTSSTDTSATVSDNHTNEAVTATPGTHSDSDGHGVATTPHVGSLTLQSGIKPPTDFS